MTQETGFPIVGIGASAGAVEALEGFFRGMPDNPGLACVIVTHLSPDRESMLPEIVARFTSMPVHAIADGVPIEIDSVYLLPRDAVVSVANRTLYTQPQDKPRRERKPIDFFLSTLAADIGELSAGVILSGGDSDGTLGIKALCIFSPHSVIRDPPFSRLDLVSCRNLLIYFGTEIQNQVIPTFHYSLRPDGYLFLGTSENVSQFDELFTPLEKKHRIFRCRADVSSQVRLPLTVSALKVGHMAVHAQSRPSLVGGALRQVVDSHMLDRFTPPHVLATRDGDVVYYSARTGKYLEAAAGAPTRQLFGMARKGLGLDLRSVFREAVEFGRPMTREGVVIDSEDGRVQVITLTVEPLVQQPQGELMYLVVFSDQGPVLSREEAIARAQSMRDGTAVQIEHELRDTRERLQSMIEEYETALEELKSSNEELVSVNEELQSSNEELEASKEELVSLNEELHTVNIELNGKIDALDRSNSDLQNLFESTSVATVFLDRNLVIRSFTPAMSSIFHIRQIDRGRPITELVSRLELPGLEDDIRRVFDTDEPCERQVDSHDRLTHFLVRLAPYRNGDRRTDGVVIAFVEITGIVHAEARQNVLIAELQHRTRNLLSVIQSIAQQTLAGDEALDRFTSRLAALGRLQGLIGEANGHLIDLGDIVRLEFDALGVADGERVSIGGPVVPLGFRNVQTIALVLHELATNAVKYGALKQDDARLSVRWDVRPNAAGPDALVIDWIESGMRIAPDDKKIGFGRQLIEKALRFTLHAQTELAFNPDGVSCHIEIPLTPAHSHGSSP